MSGEFPRPTLTVKCFKGKHHQCPYPAKFCTCDCHKPTALDAVKIPLDTIPVPTYSLQV